MLVVGARIVGVLAALQLRREGRDVVLIDKHRVGTGVTGYTTAKISSLHQLVYGQLRSRLGEETARAYAAANEAGLERIARLVDELIDCDFRRRPNYTYAATPEETEQVQEEAESAAAAGLDAAFVRDVPLPFTTHGAVRVPDRAEFSRSASWWAPPRPWSVRRPDLPSTRA